MNPCALRIDVPETGTSDTLFRSKRRKRRISLFFFSGVINSPRRITPTPLSEFIHFYAERRISKDPTAAYLSQNT